MSTPVEHAIYQIASTNAALIAALPAERMYPDVASQTQARPYAVYQRIDAQHEHHLGGASGLCAARIQWDVYADGHAAAASIGDLLREALDGWRGTQSGVVIQQCHLKQDQTEFVEQPTGGKQTLRRVSHDYQVWYTETVPTH